jgi:phosphate/sulfate permease
VSVATLPVEDVPEWVAMGVASRLGPPASTTAVRSSGVRGTMGADQSGNQGGTVREIPPAWSITLPAVMVSALIDRAAALVTG